MIKLFVFLLLAGARVGVDSVDNVAARVLDQALPSKLEIAAKQGPGAAQDFMKIVDFTHQALMEALRVEIEAVEWPEDVDSVEIAEFFDVLKNRGEPRIAELAWRLPRTRNALQRLLRNRGADLGVRVFSNREFSFISTEEIAVTALVAEVALKHESSELRRFASFTFDFLVTRRR